MHSRVVYYSRGGTTRLLAEALAARLVAELSEITCKKYKPGLIGYLSAGRDAMRGATPPITVEPESEPPDCLLIGTPVWAGKPAAPVQSFMAGLQELPARVGVFITSGGPPPQPNAQARVSELLGRAPDAWLMLQEGDVKAGTHMDAIDDFLRDLAGHVSHPGGQG